MSTAIYLQHFGLKDLPFTLTPNTAFYCNLSGYQQAFNTLLFSVQSGEGFIKIVGEVGSGKTLLCRKLLDSLDGHFVTAYIPNPDIDSTGLRIALAKELGLRVGAKSDPHQLLEKIHEALISYKAEGKRVVLVVDEAQALADETLEALRLLSNLETESEKLLQIVLFGQPELDIKLGQYRFRQLQQRIGFGYALLPLTQREVQQYVNHRLAMAGYTKGDLVTRAALSKLYYASGGVPRVINILCHKALLAAYGRGIHQVDRRAMIQAITDSPDVLATLPKRRWWSRLFAMKTLRR